MSYKDECEFLHLCDTSINELLQEIENSVRYGLQEDHIIRLEEITREWRKTH